MVDEPTEQLAAENEPELDVEEVDAELTVDAEPEVDAEPKVDLEPEVDAESEVGLEPEVDERRRRLEAMAARFEALAEAFHAHAEEIRGEVASMAADLRELASSGDVAALSSDVPVNAGRESAGARMVAMQMTVAGVERERIAGRLEDEFGVEDPDEILDTISPARPQAAG